MNILFLAPRLPLPADTGGKIRTLNILKQVSKFADVHLACFSFEAEDKQYARELENKGIRVTLVPLEEPSPVKKVIDVLLNPTPYSIGKYNSGAMSKVLAELSAQTKFDAVHVDHLHMAHYWNFDGVPMILDEHNVEYKILERCAQVERSPVKKMIFAGQAGRMKRFEREKAARFARCLTVSEDDKKFLEEITDSGVRVEVIPNGVDTEFFRSQDTSHKSQEKSLVFTGSMDWLPNSDAVLYFCQEVMPLIWKKDPDVKFTIVGKGPTEAVKQLGEKDNRIIVTGRVDDVRPLMAKAAVFVVPIRVGGGTRLKILEAMSMQKAVVSTTLGAEGIKYTNEKDIVIADQPGNFAEKVLQLLGAPEKCRQMGHDARELVCGMYDWNIVGEKLKNIY